MLTFLAANTVKIMDGGWLPVTIGIVFFVVLTTWHRGRQLSDASRNKAEGDLQTFVNELHQHDVEVQRIPGCAVFLSRGKSHAPLAMRANVEHNHTLHACTILLTVHTESVPSIDPSERISIDDLGFADDGITHVAVQLGYRDHPSLPAILRQAVDEGLDADPDNIDDASYFLSVSRLRVTDAPGMATWRKHLYLTETQLTSDPIEFFDLPRKRTISMGAEIDI